MKSTYVVNTHDGLFIKRIEVKDDKIILQSTNNNFNDIVIASYDINIIGRVCGVFLKV
jgi:phage repressor protein C with HTH and peptisase S24 domain